MPRSGLVSLVCLVLLSWATLGISASLSCKHTDLVVYTAVFQANWSRELFPKQYPEWRPPAQWSRVVGISHNEDYRLFQLGSLASPELKFFAETGKQEILGNENGDETLDQFLLPAIKNGSGTVRTNFFVDGNHSRVSLVARIVPSPDWFVGIDSLDLCADGHWVDTVTVEASPIDAGTDNGFTFTAPNWATEPQEPIYKITAQYPRHPANSFHYPNLADLPPIAKFIIFKHKTYHKAVEKEISEPSTIPEATSVTPPQDTAEAENTIPIQDAAEPTNDPLRKHSKRKVQKKKRSKSHGFSKRCKVSEWSEWTPCNGLCGQSIRKRTVSKPGHECPPLLQKRTCGCTKYVFNWKK